MRVLSVQHYPTYGGPTNEIIRLNPPLKAMDIETVVAITDEAGDALPNLRAAGIETYALSLGRLRMSGGAAERLAAPVTLRGDVRRLRGLIRGLSPDVVKVHGPHNPQGALAAALEGRAVVWVVSSTRVPRLLRPVGGVLVAKAADAILVTGHAVIAAYPGLARAADRTFPYYPPVDVDRFVPLDVATKLSIRRDLGIPETGALVVSIANVNPQKGLEFFLKAASRIARGHDCQFAVAGAVSAAHRGYFERLKRDAETLKITDRVHWLGARRDVERVVGAADLKIISSRPRSEGAPTTAGEAMACGVPVIATRMGSIAEVVEDGVNGVLVAPDDWKAIARSASSLLDDGNRRREMGVHGRGTVQRRFSAEVCAATHRDAYVMALRCAKGVPNDTDVIMRDGVESRPPHPQRDVHWVG